jgi:pteridine reductase
MKTRSKKVFITGGIKRIGKAIALFLSQKGFSIIFHYNESESKSEADALLNLIRENGEVSVGYPANFADPITADEVLHRIFSDHPDIDILINSVSKFEPNHAREVPLDKLNDFFTINLKYPEKVCQHAVNAGITHIINISDEFSSYQTFDYSQYLLTKQGLNEFTKLSASHFSPFIRINAIAPGPTAETINTDIMCETQRLEDPPIDKKSSIKDLLNGIEFLIETDSITGEILHIDGGPHL